MEFRRRRGQRTNDIFEDAESIQSPRRRRRRPKYHQEILEQQQDTEAEQ